jgi:hypothetical protein
MNSTHKRIVASLLLSVLSMSHLLAQSLTGTIITTEQDIDKPVRVIAKRGDLIAMDSTFMLGETYTADWSTVGVDKFDYQLPQPKLLGIANSVSNDGNIYPIVSGDHSQVSYRVYDIQGREIQSKSNLSAGKYFLKLMNKSNDDLLGVQSFVLLSHQLNVQFKSNPANTRLRKPAEDADSLVITYEADDMELEPYREAVVVPETGITQLDIELIRNRRGPLIHFSNVPESPTIDTTYIIEINAISPDYDDHVTEVDVFHLLGDSIQYEFNGVDSLIISPHTHGDHEFHVLVNTEYAHRGRNIELTVESQSYRLVLTKLFHGLGLPRSGLDVSLLGKVVRTGEDGLAAFELTTSMILDETDSLDIDDNILGNLQEGTGPFAAMRFPIEVDLIDSPVPDTIQTYTDPIMLQDSTYWNSYVWENQIDREVYMLSLHLNLNDTYVFANWGSLETGSTNMKHYSPEHYSSDGSQGVIDYRIETQAVIDTIAAVINEIAGEGATPKTMIVVAPEDSMSAILGGNIFDFSEFYSQLMYIEYDVDYEVMEGYIFRAGEYVSGSSGSPQALRRTMAHELGRAVGFGVLTPYDPDHPEYLSDIMGSGQLQPHDYYSYYFVLNADQHILNRVRNLSSISPTAPW